MFTYDFLIGEGINQLIWLKLSLHFVDYVNFIWSPIFIGFFLFICLIYKSNLRKNFPVEFDYYLRTSFPISEQTETIDFDAIKLEFIQKNGSEYLTTEDGKFLTSVEKFTNILFDSIQKNHCGKVLITQSAFPIFLNLNNSINKNNLAQKYYSKNIQLHPPQIRELIFDSSKFEPEASFSFIDNAKILVLKIKNNYFGEIQLTNCWIAALEIDEFTENNSISLTLRNCFIGTLKLGPNSCDKLSIINCGINELICPASNAKSPVKNLFEIDQNTYSYEINDIRNQKLINFRNLSFHIRNKAHPYTNQLINAIIFRLEMKSDSGFLKLINISYRNFTDYNTKPELAIVWIFCSFIFCFLCSFFFDLSVATKGCSIDIVQAQTWYSQFCGNDLISNGKRSFILTLNSFINPFSIFSDLSSIKSNNLLFSIWLQLIGVMNLVWISLLIFSIKIRFSKKSSSGSSDS